MQDIVIWELSWNSSPYFTWRGNSKLFRGPPSSHLLTFLGCSWIPECSQRLLNSVSVTPLRYNDLVDFSRRKEEQRLCCLFSPRLNLASLSLSDCIIESFSAVLCRAKALGDGPKLYRVLLFGMQCCQTLSFLGKLQVELLCWSWQHSFTLRTNMFQEILASKR